LLWRGVSFCIFFGAHSVTPLVPWNMSSWGGKPPFFFFVAPPPSLSALSPTPLCPRFRSPLYIYLNTQRVFLFLTLSPDPELTFWLAVDPHGFFCVARQQPPRPFSKPHEHISTPAPWVRPVALWPGSKAVQTHFRAFWPIPCFETSALSPA